MKKGNIERIVDIIDDADLTPRVSGPEFVDWLRRYDVALSAINSLCDEDGFDTFLAVRVRALADHGLLTLRRTLSGE